MKKNKWKLHRVRLDGQGYATQGGYYYGVGAPVWYAAADEGNGWPIDTFRASDREAAKAYVRKIDPAARFYR